LTASSRFAAQEGGAPPADRSETSSAAPPPVEDPLSQLPTGRRILTAARRLLAEGGYSAITLERTAAAAGVNKATVRYNFGNKAGLIGSLVTAMLHDEFGKGLAAMSPAPDEDGARALVEGKRRVILTIDSFPGFFDILPHAFRDEQLRRRLAPSYPWWAEQNLRLLGLQGTGPEGRHPLIEGLGRLVSAIADGLSIQAGLMGEDADLDAPLGALETLLRGAAPRLEEMAAPPAAVAGASGDQPSRG
jgi:AcrR family transcriptional regulator